MTVPKELVGKAIRRVRRSGRRAGLRAQAKGWVYAQRLRGNRGRVTVLFHPERPRPFAMLYGVCHRLGYRISNDPSAAFDIGVFWLDETVRSPPAELVAAAERAPVLNLRAVDISKSAVERAQHAAFGYALGVDPRSYVGTFLRKSEENATHDGTVVHGPVSEPEPGFIYQRVVDNLRPDGLVEDLRIPVLLGRIPYVSYRRRSLSSRFGSGSVVGVETVPTEEALSAEEVEMVVAVAGELGVEYGELDALRSRDDGRLYVVDVNPMPSGPPPALRRQRREVIDLMADELERSLAQLVGVRTA